MRVLFYFKSIFFNSLTTFLNIFIWRSKKIWLFGSWMGLKFSDNSRFLFQFLDKNKNKYNIKKTIWISRDKNLVKELKDLGYEAYFVYSFKSFYYHIKSGVHVICNMPSGNKKFKGDICGYLSLGAIKLQCWHGIPIKSNLVAGGKNRFINTKFFRFFFDAGHWYKQFVFSTGPMCTELMKKWFYGKNYEYIECGYPRYCKCELLFDIESDVINIIKSHRMAILYLPTFRKYPIEFQHPLENEELCDYLITNDIIWIEKPHQASSDNYFNYANKTKKFVFQLKSEFDINVIIPNVSIIITDFSSVAYDGLYFGKPLLYYAPDFKKYADEDRGFLNYSIIDENSENPSCLLANLKRVTSGRKLANSSNDSLASSLFGRSKFSYESIMDMLKEIVYGIKG